MPKFWAFSMVFNIWEKCPNLGYFCTFVHVLGCLAVLLAEGLKAHQQTQERLSGSPPFTAFSLLLVCSTLLHRPDSQ